MKRKGEYLTSGPRYIGQPDVRADMTGNSHLKFFTSDLPGKYLVVLQGLNGNGEAVSATHSFTVE